MRINFFEDIAGTTFRATWVSSGVTPGLISSALRDSAENIISSVQGISSGNGFYYAFHTLPTSPGWFINEWTALIGINQNTYIKRQFIRGVFPET